MASNPVDQPLRSIELWESFVPPTTTHQSKNIVNYGGRHARLADSPKLVSARELYRAMLIKNRPTIPFTGPVDLEIFIVWPHRKSETKTNLAKGLMRSHDKRPDLSNIGKTIEDILVELRFIVDDGQVSDTSCKKRWGVRPGIGIRITEVPIWREPDPGIPQ